MDLQKQKAALEKAVGVAEFSAEFYITNIDNSTEPKTSTELIKMVEEYAGFINTRNILQNELERVNDEIAKATPRKPPIVVS